VTTPFFVGTLLIMVGGIIRMCCYRALGKLFTFEFTIREGHKLVTSGPYSIVRHPSYTGGLIGLAGSFLCQLTEGSWMRECGVLQTISGKCFVGFWVFMELWRRGYAVKRAAQEDDVMKKEFGAQWIAWSQRVRYRILPGIY
jgi:protein-S-isoprenylcysteine O-methyltransferase Ste14